MNFLTRGVQEQVEKMKSGGTQKQRVISQTIEMEELLSLSGKRILGVNPPVRDFAFMDLWSKPLGLLYILQSMKERCRVELFDAVAAGSLGEKSFGRQKIKKTEIEKPEIYGDIPRRFNQFGLTSNEISVALAQIQRPDFIFLTSGMTYWYLGAREMITLMREAFPDTPIALGGIYAALCAEHAATLGADYIVRGHSEPSAPYPAMDLYGAPPYGVIMTSFGCPFSCRYCASNLLWPSYRRRGLSEVLTEIDYQAALGARDFAFYDDALLLEKENFFYPLCRELSTRYGNKLRLHTPNGLHVRQIDARCAAALAENNFRTIRLSLESVDPKVAADSSGKVARGEYAAAVKNLRAAGYSREDCETYILLGLPGQDTASVRETIDFVWQNGGTPKLAEFSPIPGTPYFEEAAQKLPALRTAPLLQNNSVYCSYLAREIAPERLQELKDSARRPRIQNI